MKIFKKKHLVFCFFVIVFTICFTTCVIGNILLKGIGIDKSFDKYTITYVEDENNKNYSVPVAANIVEIGSIIYKPPTEDFNLMPLGLNDIFISGVFRVTDSEKSDNPNNTIIFFPWLSPTGQFFIWQGTHNYKYGWNGRIVIDENYYDSRIRIQALSYYEHSNLRHLFLLESETNMTSIVFNNNQISQADLVPHAPPYQFGNIHFNGNEYIIYGVIERDHVEFHNNFTEKERNVKRYDSSRTIVSSVAEFFVNDTQKFQICGSSGFVVAEIAGSSYTIYDSLPATERDAIKQGIALLHTYRLIVRNIVHFDIWENLRF